MTDPDSFYSAAERRIEWLTLGWGLAGLCSRPTELGFASGGGSGFGASLTWLNFRWLKQGVAALVEVSTAQAGSEHARVPLIVYVKFFGALRVAAVGCLCYFFAFLVACGCGSRRAVCGGGSYYD